MAVVHVRRESPPHAGFMVLNGFYAVTHPSHHRLRDLRGGPAGGASADDLDEARTELAEAAVLRERLRISRDLHDGLGRSLTAIALKGDLAAPADGPRPRTAARGEVAELMQVARDAGPGRTAGGAGLPGDVADRARCTGPMALLEAVRGELPDPPRRPPELPRQVGRGAGLGGARGGHQRPAAQPRRRRCTISTSVHGGAVRLEVVNDGAPVSACAARPGGGADRP